MDSSTAPRGGCRTFTHHVEDAIRVECQQHTEWVEDVPPQTKGEVPTSRQIATQAQRRHESGEELA